MRYLVSALPLEEALGPDGTALTSASADILVRALALCGQYQGVRTWWTPQSSRETQGSYAYIGYDPSVVGTCSNGMQYFHDIEISETSRPSCEGQIPFPTSDHHWNSAHHLEPSSP